MNTDDHQPLDPHSDEALEARIVAWVLGEASAFEIAELKRLCAERPELEAFRRHMAELHGLLVDQENADDDAQWKLSPQKRAVVTALYGGEDEVAKERRIQRIAGVRVFALAACMTLIAVAVSLLKFATSGIGSSSTAAMREVDFLPGGGGGGGGESFDGKAEQRETLALEVKPAQPPVIGRLSASGGDGDALDGGAVAAKELEGMKPEPQLAASGELAESSGRRARGVFKDEMLKTGDGSLASRGASVDEKTGTRLAEREDSIARNEKNAPVPSATPAPVLRGSIHSMRSGDGKVSRESISELLDSKDAPAIAQATPKTAEAPRVESKSESRAGGTRANMEELKKSDLAAADAAGSPDATEDYLRRDSARQMALSDKERAMKGSSGKRVYAQGASSDFDLPPANDSFGEMSGLSSLAGGGGRGSGAGMSGGLGGAQGKQTAAPGNSETAFGYVDADQTKREGKPVDRLAAPAESSAPAGEPQTEEAITRGSFAGHASGSGVPATVQSTSKNADATDAPIRSNAARDATSPANATDIVRRSLYASEGAFELGKLDDAKREAENALRADPYNQPARRLMERINAAHSDYYKAAYDHTRSELLMKVDRTWGGETAEQAAQKNDNEDSELRQLSKAVRDQQDKVDDKRKALKVIQLTRGVTCAEDEGLASKPSEERMRETATTEDYFKIAQQQQQIEAQIKTLQKLGGDQLIASAAGLELPDNAVKTLYPQYLEQKVKLEASKASGLGATHPTVLAQQEAMAATKKQLDDGVAVLRGTLQAQSELCQKRLAVAEQTKVARKEKAISSSVNREEFNDAKREFIESQKTLQALEMKLAVARANKNSPKLPNPSAQPLARKPLVITDELTATAEPFSTFSLHVSDASFVAAKAALDRGERPAPASVRLEEFYNAFDYGDPAPAKGEAVACRIEQAAHPVLPQRNLVRVAMRTGAAGRAASQPLHLTVLLDSSGSMEREDRKEGLKRAMEQLAGLLGENDRITLAGFARTPRLMAESLPGNRAKELVAMVAQTPSEGGTNLEEALRVAGQLALRQKNANAQNRIVLLTDGAANLGNAKPEALAQQIAALRQQGIAFDAAGIGAGDANDQLLEQLTRNGDGRYYLIRGAEDADANFAAKLAGAFRPAAENVKVQVRFNPERVGRYKLIGFEKHRLNTEDFRNDKVDAAELAAEEAGVAIYQVETLPEGKGELGEVSVRFRDAASGGMVERSWTMGYDPRTPAFDRATPSMQLATLAMFAGEKLHGGPLADAIDFSKLSPQLQQVRAYYAASNRVRDLVAMIQQLR